MTGKMESGDEKKPIVVQSEVSYKMSVSLSLKISIFNRTNQGSFQSLQRPQELKQ